MRRPNIIYLHSHDTGRYIAPYGHAVPTPHLSRFADQSVVFRNAFCANPTCSPSRAALLTGQWAHSAGMLGLTHRGFALHDYSQHLVHTLKRAGYLAVQCGTQHVCAPADVQRLCGYDRVLPTQGKLKRAEAASAFLRGPHDQPFFLDVGFFETHRPFPDPDGDEPLTSPDRVRAPSFLADHPQIRSDMAAYNTMARTLDEGYGQILSALDQAGLADNTLVLITTDHGIAFPHAKCCLTDHGIGVLLMMRWPDSPLFEAGRTIEAMTSQIDLFPTLCDLLDIEPPAWLQGESLVPVLAHKCDEHRDEVFAEVNFHCAYEPQRCIRTSRYKLIRRYDDLARPVLPNCDGSPSKALLIDNGWLHQPRPQSMLYDLLHDPDECINLFDRPELARIQADLEQRLQRWMQDTDDPILHGLPIPPPPGSTLRDPQTGDIVVTEPAQAMRRVV